MGAWDGQPRRTRPEFVKTHGARAYCFGPCKIHMSEEETMAADAEELRPAREARVTALDLAIRVHGVTADPATIVHTAKQFAEFIEGDAPAPASPLLKVVKD